MERRKKEKFDELQGTIQSFKDSSSISFWNLGRALLRMRNSKAFESQGISSWRKYVRDEVGLDLSTVQDIIVVYETFEPYGRGLLESQLIRGLGWSKVRVLCNYHDLIEPALELKLIKLEELLMYGIQNSRRDLEKVFDEVYDETTLWSKVYGQTHFPLEKLSSEVEIFRQGVHEVLHDIENKYGLSMHDKLRGPLKNLREDLPEEIEKKETIGILTNLRRIEIYLSEIYRLLPAEPGLILDSHYEVRGNHEESIFETLVENFAGNLSCRHGEILMLDKNLEYELKTKRCSLEEVLKILDVEKSKFLNWKESGYLDTDKPKCKNKKQDPKSEMFSFKTIKKAYLIKQNLERGQSLEESLENATRQLEKKSPDHFQKVYYGLLRRAIKKRESTGNHLAANELRPLMWHLFIE